MQRKENAARWVGYWKFHLPTKKADDARRVFERVAKRVGFDASVSGSGVRGARPGTWTTVERWYSGSLGDALVSVMDGAGLCGEHIDMPPPQRYEGGLVVVPGWMARCNHSELAAVDFELRNKRYEDGHES